MIYREDVAEEVAFKLLQIIADVEHKALHGNPSDRYQQQIVSGS
jgi:hypothetical protein